MKKLQLFLLCLEFVDSNTNVEDVFIPTSEWQTVKENQAIPKGLHIRLNMQTGAKEAKLLDEDPDGEKMRAINKDLFKEKLPMASRKLDPEEIKSALKNLKDKSSNTKFKVEELSLDESELISNEINANDDEVKSKFRSYEELKKDFEGMNLTIKTDGEIMTELLSRYNRSEGCEKSEKLDILKDFEYYVHQYDNGLLFCDIGAFELLVGELNSTKSDAEIKIMILMTLGSAMQGYNLEKK